jgi:8-oxo-dGTP diphosphatase
VASSLRKQPAIAVGAVIRNPNGDVLLVRRGRAPRLGEWSIPGGKIEWGESVENALIREVREETGLTIEVLGLIGVVDSFTEDPSGNLSHHYVLLDFAANSEGEGLKAGDDVIEVRWVPSSELAGFNLWSETLRIISLSEALTGNS